MYRCDVTSVKQQGMEESRNGQENLSINDSSDVFLIVFLFTVSLAAHCEEYKRMHADTVTDPPIRSQT